MRFQFQRGGCRVGSYAFSVGVPPMRNLLSFFSCACGRSIGGERFGRFGFICAPSASRGHAVERAFHLLLNALNGPTADANFAGNPQDAFAGAQLSLDARFSMAASIRGLPSCVMRPGPSQPLLFQSRRRAYALPRVWSASISLSPLRPPARSIPGRLARRRGSRDVVALHAVRKTRVC
jgi:hypothetical protein